MRYEEDLKESYKYYTSEELNELYYNMNKKEKKRITDELKRRVKDVN